MNDRTPVILPPDRIDAWLDPSLTDKDAAQKLITGIEYEPLQVRAVSAKVNKTGRGGSHGPELIEPLADHADEPLQLVSAQPITALLPARSSRRLKIRRAVRRNLRRVRVGGGSEPFAYLLASHGGPWLDLEAPGSQQTS
jgi:SOS response associated peptidase (SRAP)